MSRMAVQHRVAAVILAAGASSRFGSMKQLAPFDGGTMLDAVIETSRRASLDPLIVVASSTLPLPEDIVRVPNDEPSAGLARSLRLGLAAVPASSAAIILLADQPTVTPAHLAQLLNARGSRPIVATEAAGVLGPPALLEPAAFHLADRIEGDRGLRDVLRSQPDNVASVAIPRHFPDVDEPSDLAALGETALD